MNFSSTYFLFLDFFPHHKVSAKGLDSANVLMRNRQKLRSPFSSLSVAMVIQASGLPFPFASCPGSFFCGTEKEQFQVRKK